MSMNEADTRMPEQASENVGTHGRIVADALTRLNLLMAAPQMLEAVSHSNKDKD